MKLSTAFSWKYEAPYTIYINIITLLHDRLTECEAFAQGFDNRNYIEKSVNVLLWLVHMNTFLYNSRIGATFFTVIFNSPS